MNYFPSTTQIVKLLGFMTLMTLVISVPVLIIDYFIIEINESLKNLIIYSFPSITTAQRYLKKRQLYNSDDYRLRIKKVDRWIFTQIILMSILFVVIIDQITTLIPTPEWFIELMNEQVSNDLYSFLTIVIIAPIFEEIIFRGIILDGFLKKFSANKSILLSSLLFAIIHLNPWQGIGAFIAGLFLGWIYFKTQSIIPCIAIHLTNNLISFIATIYISSDSFIISTLTQNNMISTIIFILSALLLFIGMKELDKQLKNQQQTQ